MAATRLFIACVMICIAAGLLGADERPNILLVLVDDMGYSDLGCYGGEIDTPQIDSLAANGLRFSGFYNTGRCCPTRASLLTGLYPHQTGVGKMTFEENRPGYRGFLQPNCVTIAEVLREAGYQTSMVGKWHLSQTRMGPRHMRNLNNQVLLKQFSDPETYPVGRGFDSHYGIIWGVVNHFDPFTLVRDTTPVQNVEPDYYTTDAFTDEAVAKIHEHAESDSPFFLYVAYTAPHWPLHAREEDIARYRDTYSDGWQSIREARYQKQLEMGLFKNRSDIRLSPRHDASVAWTDEPKKEWEMRAMAVHAAMIDRIDQGVGKLVDALRATDKFDNTLILFLSDNGASPERPAAPGFDRYNQTRRGEPVTYFGTGMPREVLPGNELTCAGIGPRWANVANTPFRYWKGDQHEGGIRTPLIVHWPTGLATNPGSITHQDGHVMDLAATCLDAAEARYPKIYQKRAITPLEGKSLLPILRGKPREGHKQLFFEHYGHKAVREGDLKMVAGEKGPWELYDLSTDPTELHNLADKQPNVIRRLAADWQGWAERTGVVDTKNAKKNAEAQKKLTRR
ncbi:MAG TPA: arylsulfatase [Pirellulales bacterium]|jgi:arylsulfatase|nr:arylsulfatase [Pirellulales bacterium]